MDHDLLGGLMYLARSVLNPILFTIAGLILVVARPRWHGPWWLVVGAVLSVAVVGIRLLGPPRDASANVWLAYAESLGFVLAGIGVLLVALRAREV